MYFLVENNLSRKSSKQQRQNSLLHLISREYEAKRNCRRDHRITRSIITGGLYSFKRCWDMKSPQRITCDGRYAFFSNYQKCIDCSSPEEKPYVKFTLNPRNRNEKIEDAVIMEGTPENMDLPYKGYKGCLLAITKSNLLLRIDLESGDILEHVKLGMSAVKFKKINWNNMDETFVITSKQFPHHISRHNLPHPQEVSEIVQFIIMACMPLGFVAKFSITREIFGKNVVEAIVSLDILMVMDSTSHVRMYNMRTLLDTHKLHEHRLYEEMCDGLLYGSDQCPLTPNMDITECPPCLLEVRCRERDVMVTMPPCHYVMWPWSQAKGYCCFSVETGQMVDNGCLEAEEDSLEEKVALHTGDSGRIIHMRNSELRVFKIVSQAGVETGKMVEDFGIQLAASPSEPPTQTAPTVSLSGRIIKKRVIQDCQAISDRMVLSMMYSEDLDMIILLSCYGEISTDDKQKTLVGFYDNWNGKLYRQFELEEAPSEEVAERFFTYDEDTITHVFRSLQGKMECHVYKMQCLLREDEEPEGTQRNINRLPKQPRQRTRSRR